MSWHTLPPTIRTIAEQELTDRQLTVLKLSLGGMSTHSIALALGITEPTARKHLERAHTKLAPHLKDVA
jgi:DNA-binding CsgD family transcriptional regulator